MALMPVCSGSLTDWRLMMPIYLAETRHSTREVVERIFAGERPEPAPAVTLTDFDPEGEDKLLAAICYPQTHLSDTQLLAKVRTLSADDRVALLHAYVGERGNRRHKPGPARERCFITGASGLPETTPLTGWC